MQQFLRRLGVTADADIEKVHCAPVLCVECARVLWLLRVCSVCVYYACITRVCVRGVGVSACVRVLCMPHVCVHACFSVLLRARARVCAVVCARVCAVVCVRVCVWGRVRHGLNP